MADALSFRETTITPRARPRTDQSGGRWGDGFDGCRISARARRSDRSSTGGRAADGWRSRPCGSLLMGGFFLLCAGPGENRANEMAQLQRAFAELGFACPEIIKGEGYVLAAYPKLQTK